MEKHHSLLIKRRKVVSFFRGVSDIIKLVCVDCRNRSIIKSGGVFLTSFVVMYHHTK